MWQLYNGFVLSCLAGQELKDIAEVYQGHTGSSVTTGIWSPVSGDTTGPFLVRAVWKRWKGQLAMNRSEKRGEAHGSIWRRVLSIYRELQGRRLVDDMIARICSYRQL